jgi:RNA polymerase sigma-70 factor (ECF subfamily)
MESIQQEMDPEKWVDRFGDILFRFALLRVGNPGLAEDLVQETLCSAFESQKWFSGRSTEKTWLVGILKHKIADYFRRSGREAVQADSGGLPEVEDGDFFDERGRWKNNPGDWKGSPEDVLEKKEFWEVFHRCLDGLSPNLRQAFTLREIDEMESGEICKVLNISATNLWVILHRARAGLRRCLEFNWFQGTR